MMTKIIFMDEAFAKLLDLDDWKVHCHSLTGVILLLASRHDIF